MDRLDAVAIGGFGALVASSLVLDGVVVGAMLAGFALSLALWRLYGGRPWEALGWLAWVGAAVALVLDPGGTVLLLAFLAFALAGVGLLFGGRFDVLVDVWTVDRE